MPEYTIKCVDIMVMFKSLVSHTDQGANQATDQTNQGDNNIVLLIKTEFLKKLCLFVCQNITKIAFHIKNSCPDSPVGHWAKRGRMSIMKINIC